MTDTVDPVANASPDPSDSPVSTPAPPPVSPVTSATTSDPPAFGWSGYAERINGRFAMVGFTAILVIEALSGDTFLHWAGLVP
jgi:hypothetical protein